MAEILVLAKNNTHSNPEKDRCGCYKRGMPVVVRPDGHEWGLKERLPDFVVIKIPLVPVERVLKYIAIQKDLLNPAKDYRRRCWIIRWDDLPVAARNKLRTAGELVIKARSEYTGAFDYTWAQVKTFFLNQQTMLNESQDV